MNTSEQVMSSMTCPEGHDTLESISGDYPTGVVAPDGGREYRYEEGYYCEKCRRVYDVEDCESEGE